MGRRFRTSLLAAAVAAAALVAVPSVAQAAASLTITPTTWNVIGLDSNKPSVSSGRPNEFPVGAKVCNGGDAAASGVQASWAWTTANSNLSLATPSATTRAIGTLAPGACAHVTYNVLINRNQQSFNARTRGYQITATAAGGLTAATPASRELYVEKLVSQSRNSVLGITSAACSGGSCTVYRGQTYTFTLNSKTATGGYEQLETFVNFPDSIFEIVDVKTSYAAPAGATNDQVYADACGWDAVTTSPTYRSCVGPTRYSGGKAGGNPIKTVYTVKVVGTGSGTLSGLVYDFSGSSFHYNADFGSGVNALPFTASDAADLSVTKSHGGAFVRGGTGTYRITVDNAGPATSGSIIVTDTLPAGLTYRSSSGSGWSCSCSAFSQTLQLTRSGLAPGASSSFDLTVDVAAGAAASVTNTASVLQSTSSTLNDPASGNNSTADPTTVADPGEADLVVTKSRDQVFTPGGNETYTIHLRNDGPGTVLGPVTVTDELPAGLTYVSATGTGWTCGAAGQTVTCTLPEDLRALEQAPDITLVVAVAENAPPRGTNRTSATGSVDNDPNDPNNVNLDDTVLVGEADLWIEKSHTGSFGRGGSGSYSIVVGNRGPHAAATPRVVDSLPSGLTFASASGTGWTCSSAGQAVTCDRASGLASGSTAPRLTIVTAVAANAASSVTNHATVCSVAEAGSVTGCPNLSQGTHEVAPSDNSAEDLTATVAPTDLSLANTASVASVDPGTAFTYTLAVTNNGPNAAANVTVVDTLPVYIDPASISTNPGSSNNATPPYCDVTEREVTCFLGTVSATAGSNTATATITAKALSTAAGRTIVNTATVFSDLGDTNASNDSASSSVAVNGALVNSAPVAADKTATVRRSSTAGTDVVLSATDADGDPLTFGLAGANGGAAHGTVTVSGNVATYVPSGSFVGTDTFQYRANDGAADSAPATVSVTVTNAAPTAAARTASVPHRGTGAAIALTGSDADGDALTFDLVGLDGGAARGSVTISGDTATYVPSGDFVGTDTFEYRANDGAETSAPATVTVTLTNAAPTLAAAALTPETIGAAGTLTAAAVSPADADGDDLTYTYVWRRTRGGVTETLETSTLATATDTYELSGGAAGDEITVSITAHDGHAGSLARSDSAVVGNSPPTAASATATTTEDTPEPITLTGDDADGDPLAYVVTSLPAHGSLYEGAPAGAPIATLPFDLAGDDVTYVPAPGYNGSDGFTFQTNDGSVSSSQALVTISVLPVNDAPVASAGTLTVAGDETSGGLDLAGLAADAETPDANLTYEIVDDPAGGTATLNGSTVTYTRTAAGRSADSFSFKVTDRGDPDDCGLPLTTSCSGALDSNVATISVAFDNAAPEATRDALVTAEDTRVTITLSGTDADGDDLSFDVTSLPEHGSLYTGSDASGTPLANVPATLPGTRVTYVPDAGYNGPDGFEFTASDGTAASATAPVAITVTPVNDAPTAGPGEIHVAGGATSGRLDLATLAADDETADADLTYEIVDGPASGTATLAGSTVTYTRTAPGRDDDSFTFKVADGGDPDGCGTPVPGECAASRDGAPATVSVTFGNAAPSAAAGATTTPEDTAVAITLGGTDPDGDVLSYEIASLPSHGALRAGATEIDAVPFELPGSQVTYVPDANFHGDDTFGFAASDGRAGSAVAAVAVAVTPVNDRPGAAGGAMTVEGPSTGAQLDLANLVDDVETDVSDLTYELVAGPSNGTATLQGSTLTFTRDGAGRDADEITFKVTDRGDPDDCGEPVADVCAAPKESAVARVTVAFDYVRPTASPQDVTTPEDQRVALTLEGEAPSDGDRSFKVTSLPGHGSLFDGSTRVGTVPFELTGAEVVYEPAEDYEGNDGFTFVTSGLQDSAPARVGITVTAVNDRPEAVDVTASARPGTQAPVALKATDVDGDDLELSIAGGPAGGTLGALGAPACRIASGTSTCEVLVGYTPSTGFTGADTFTFVAFDGAASSAAATVTVTVAEEDEEPTTQPPPAPDQTTTPSPAPTDEPAATPGPSPSPEPSPTPSPTPSATPTPDPEEQCGAPIEVEANGDPIVGTPCGELITVYASVPATIEALGGDDTIFVFGSAEVQVSAGGGADEVSCVETQATVLGGNGRDVIECGAGDDVLRGGRGADVLLSGDGHDRVVGGSGKDRIDAGTGEDLAIGGRDEDLVVGGPGDDVLKGQGGVDTIHGGSGDDLLRGARGGDLEYGGKGDDLVRAGFGDDLVWGGRGDDRLMGNEGDDSIQGGGGHDVLRGRAGADSLRGRGGADVIRGGPGDDSLRGLGGNDRIQSGSGRNDIDGGSGMDVCVVGTTGNVWRRCERHLERRF
ncbi:MAG: Ig-like domain-containing protein [Actinomycetota bacterium]